MIEGSFVEQITPPNCIYCGEEMLEYHSKSWTGTRWVYIAVVFKCYSDNHQFAIRARTEKEWLEHVKKIENS